MKARPFLAAVLAVTLLLGGLGLGGWWLVLSRSPLQLRHQPLRLPEAARFVPRQAPLSLFLLSDLERPLAYARAVAPVRQRRQAAEAMARLRDGALAAAGLDYGGELAGWLGDEIGFSLIGGAAGTDPDGWLLSLRSRDGEGGRRFLQRFWQTRSLAGSDLQVSSYRGLGLISGRGALLGRQVGPIATALIHDDLVLIASGRGVLEQALDVSQIDGLNLASTDSFRAGLQQLGEGVALLQARPAALERWLGLPAEAGSQVRELLASLRPEGRGLAVAARLRLADGSLAWPAAGGASLAPQELLTALHGPVASLALLQDPPGLPALLQPFLQRALAAADGPLPALLSQAAHGPLLWADDADGWLLGTAAGQPDPEALQPALDGESLVRAPLTLPDGQAVRVWTRLSLPPARRGRRDLGSPLQVELLGSYAPSGPVSWWARSLPRLQEQLESRQGPRERLAQLAALERPEAPFQWALAAGRSRQLLRQWRAWQLLAGLGGQPLSEAVSGLALALEPADAGLKLTARLDFASRSAVRS